MLLWDTEIISLGVFKDVLCLSLLAASYWPVISQFYKVCPSVIATWRNPSLKENCCYISKVHGFVFCTSEFHLILVFLVLRAISHLFLSILQKIFFCINGDCKKISVSVNFVSSSPASFLWELVKSLNATDNSFLLNTFLVYCDLNIYSLFYCSSLSNLTSFSFQHHVKYFAEIPMY